MKNLKNSLSHAFSLEPEDDLISEGLPEVLERLAVKVVDRKLETPALLFLETMAPLNFLGSQFMYATMPFVKMFTASEDYFEIARVLENRQTVRLFADRIEELACKGS